MRKEEKINFGVILRVGFSLVPILFGVTLPAMILCAFNIAMSFIVFGPKTSAISSMSAVCISMLFCKGFGNGAEVEGLYIALQSILCAYACVYTIVGKKEFFSGVWLAAAGYLLPSMISFKNLASSEGMSIAEYIMYIPRQILELQVSQMASDAGNSFDIAVAEKVIDTAASFTGMIIPSIFIVVSVVVGYAVMWCIVSRLRMLPIKMAHSFSEIRIPKIMISIAILALGLYFLNIQSEVAYVAVNVFVVLFSFCLFAGISFIDYYLRPSVKSVVLRLVIYAGALIFAAPVIAPVLCLIAIIDSFADFRKLAERSLNETEEREI